MRRSKPNACRYVVFPCSFTSNPLHIDSSLPTLLTRSTLTSILPFLAHALPLLSSLLLLGRPGSGKTTLLRDTARLLADDMGLAVVVVDSSNEIAGEGDIAGGRGLPVPIAMGTTARSYAVALKRQPQQVVVRRSRQPKGTGLWRGRVSSHQNASLAPVLPQATTLSRTAASAAPAV